MQIEQQNPYSYLMPKPGSSSVDGVGQKEENGTSSATGQSEEAPSSTTASQAMRTTGPVLPSEVLSLLQGGLEMFPIPLRTTPVDYKNLIDDPERGGRLVKSIAERGYALAIKIPDREATEEDWSAFKTELAVRKAEVDIVKQERSELYGKMVEEGRTPAEIYKEFVRHELNQPDRYWAALEIGGSGGLRQQKLQELSDIHKIEADIFVKSGSDIGRPDAVIARGHALELATDSAYAAKHAYQMGHSSEMLFIPMDVFEKAVAEGDFSKISNGYEFGDPGNPTLKVLQQRQDLYDYLKENGATSLQIIEEIHKFNISLPLSYSDDFLDVSDSHPAAAWQNMQKEQLARLNAALDWAGINHPPTDIEDIPVPDEVAIFADLPGTKLADDRDAVNLEVTNTESEEELLKAMAVASIEAVMFAEVDGAEET